MLLFKLVSYFSPKKPQSKQKQPPKQQQNNLPSPKVIYQSEQYNFQQKRIETLQINQIRQGSSDSVSMEWEDISKYAVEQPMAQTFQNKYLSSEIFIVDKCEGKLLSNAEWKLMIKEKSFSSQAKKNIYFSILKGIDFEVRKEVWEFLADTSKLKPHFKYDPQQHQIPERDLVNIRKDTYRSGSVTVHFKELERILIAYVQYSKQEYTQGMNFIVGSLLSLLDLTNDSELDQYAIIEDEFQERVFWVFVGIMKQKHWENIFQNNLAGVLKMLQKLKCLMAKHTPKILEKMQKYQLEMTIFSQHYITILLYNTPKEFSKIVLDLFLLDGQEVIHSLLIRMMVIQQEKILKLSDEGEFMSFMKKDFIHQCFAKMLKDRSQANGLEDLELNYMKIDCN